GIVRGEEEYEAGYLVCVGHAAQGDLVGDSAAGFVGGRDHHRRLDVARVDRVHADVVGSVLDRDVFGHPAGGELAAHVGEVRGTHDGDHAGGGGDVDDRSAAGLLHRRDDGFHAVELGMLVDCADLEVLGLVELDGLRDRSEDRTSTRLN